METKDFKCLTVGTRVTFVHSHPYMLSREVMTGHILEVCESKRHGVQYFIQPENGRMARWRSAHDILSVEQEHSTRS